MVDIIPLEPGMAVAAQLSEADIALAAARGFRAVVAVRPDGEAPDQLLQADAAEAAEKRGLAFRYLPVSGASVIDDDTVAAFARLMEELPGPVLFYCGTGTRCAILWSQAAAPRLGIDAVLATTREAGYALEVLRDTLQERSQWRAAAPEQPTTKFAPIQMSDV
ncbi:MAG: TIGR01244 family sulfur transferase [Pseudolabrys sp.]